MQERVAAREHPHLGRDVPALYRFLVEQVAAIPGISAMEVTPVQRVVKQSGTLVSDGRSAP